MERRKALYLTATMLGTSLIGSEFFLSGCNREVKKTVLISDADIALLDEVGETILPETERSPGAKAAKIGLFMKTIVSDCYSLKEQDTFTKGIIELNDMAQAEYGTSFIKLDNGFKLALLSKLDRYANTHQTLGEAHFFQMMKELTIWGYFTSEPGATIALRYLPVPGKFIGCFPYKPGDRAWAT